MSQETSDKIEISNGSSSYFISKSLILKKNPRFNDLCTSNVAGKFIVNFDKYCLRSIINWLHSDLIVINLENVIPLHEAACTLNLDSLTNDCCSFFNENFTAEKIPVLLKYIKEDTSLLNFKMLNSFLSKNFLRLINGEYFLEFPLDLVKYIISLDLLIDSEYQVFEAIIKWINHDESRITHMAGLLKCIRWCYISKSCYSKIAEDKFIVQNLQQLDNITCKLGACRNSCLNDRIKEMNLITIYYVEDKIIGICYYVDGIWESCGIFVEDTQIPSSVLHDEHMADLIFDSGRAGLRIDFKYKKYRLLEMNECPGGYYNELYYCFKPKFDKESSYRAYIQDKVEKMTRWIDLEKNTMIENKGVMNIICYPQTDSRLYAFLPVEHKDWYIRWPFANHRVHATVLNDIYYIITNSMTFHIFDSVNKTIEKSEPFEGMGFSFENLHLCSYKSNVLLLVRYQEKIMMFDTNTKLWSLMGQICTSHKMVALTSTHLSVQFLKVCMQKN